MFSFLCLLTVPGVFVWHVRLLFELKKIDEECQISEAQVVLDRFATFCLLCDWKVARSR